MRTCSRRTAVITFIIATAALARFWALTFCLPGQLCRPDEEAVAGIAMQFFGRDFNPHFFDWPTLFMYATVLGLVAYFQAGHALGWFHGPYSFMARIVTDTTPVYLTARILSAAAGTASVWILYRIARRLFDETTALVAALFLALAFLHARDSHFGVTDVPATFFLLVAFLFVVRIRDSGRTSDLVMGGIAAGLAASTKYNAALIALPAAWLLRSNWMRLLAFGALMIAAFAVTSPYCLIDWRQFIASLQSVSAHLSAGHGVNPGRGWVVHLTTSLRFGIGMPMLVAAIAGLVWIIWIDWRRGVLVGIFPIAYYLVVGSGYTVFARYIVPVVPFLCLTAAFATVEGVRALAATIAQQGRAAALTWVVALLIVAPSAVSLAQFDYLLAVPDSRVVAADWVRQHFPNGSTIAEVGDRSTNLFFIRESNIVPSRYKTMPFNDDEAVGRPDLLIIPISLFDPHPAISASAKQMAEEYQPVFQADAHSMSARGVVYDWQDQFYLPLTGFREIWRPGPNLMIYARPDVARKISFHEPAAADEPQSLRSAR
jgi:4-amino-4-deoxy-L-arabinose transferase-like glycosyltransferase